jgi:hypothetical protein
MNDRNHTESNENLNDLAGKGHGMQGVDKAPGEEPNQDNVQFQQETQKGKKVDADVEMESDRPIEQSDSLGK